MENIAVLEHVMRDYIEPAVPEVFNNELDLYGSLQKSAKGIKGYTIDIPLQIGYNERGIGAIAESGTLPTAGANEYDHTTSSLKWLYAVMSLTNQVLHVTKDDHTLIDELNRSMQGTQNAFNYDWNRQAWGDGSAQMATVSSVNGAVLGVNNIYMFRPNMYLNAWLVSGPTQRVTTAGSLTYFKVIDVDYVNSTITVSPDAGGILVGDVLAREKNLQLVDGSLVSGEITGLGAVFDTSIDLQGASASNFWWKPSLNTNASLRDLDDLALMAALDAHVARTGKVPDILYGSLGTRRGFYKMLTDLYQNVTTIPTKGGFKFGLKYVYGEEEIPMVGSRFAPGNTLRGVDLESMYLAEATKPRWDNTGGGILKPRENQDEVYGRMFYYCQLCYKRRDTFFEMDKLNEKSTSA